MAEYDAFMDFMRENKTRKDVLLPVTTSMIQHPTGYMYLDYMNGSYLSVNDEDEQPIYTYHNVGITEGSVQVLISKSQGGKTSLATSMGQGIIEPWVSDPVMKTYMAADLNPKAEMSGRPFIQIFDTEKTLPLDYVKKITQYRNKELKRHVVINPITTDKDLMSGIEQHIRFKTSTMQEINMPVNDLFGKPIRCYPPTVVIIDSMSQLLLTETDNPGMDSYDKIIQNTAGARRAKIISAIYSQLVNYAKKYNIIIFSINHINKMPAMNGVPVKQYRGLKMGETIGGGEKAIFLAAGILRLDVIKTIGGTSSSSLQLGEDEYGDTIKGHVAIANWIKSKTNARNNTCQLVYTNIAGYDRMLSLLWNGKETEDLSKSGNFYYIDKYPNIKFTMKTARETFMKHSELFVPTYLQFRDKCEKLLDNPEHAAKKNEELLKDLKDDLKDEVQSGNYSHSDANELEDIFNSVYNS